MPEILTAPPIFQINTGDSRGGAANVAKHLHENYLKLGLKSEFLVGHRYEIKAPGVHSFEELPQEPKFTHQVRKWSYKLTREFEMQIGLEPFHFPKSHRLLNYLPKDPALFHLHNLHGNYFDLRLLSNLSLRNPTLLTLHDAWLLAGHCGHSLDCERWKIGCGKCPYPKVYQELKHDLSHHNWIRKQKIYKASRLAVATPCRWLMDKVKASPLAEGMFLGEIIENGVSKEIFHPGDSEKLRAELGLPQEKFILTFAAEGMANNPWKDYSSIEKAIEILCSDSDLRGKFHLIAIGANEKSDSQLPIDFRNYLDQKELSKLFQISDFYIHLAKAETFPNVIIEALSCGTPIIASNVGGISEQITAPENYTELVSADMNHPYTGILVNPQDPVALAKVIRFFILHPKTARAFKKKIPSNLGPRFDIRIQVKKYLELYQRLHQIRLESSLSSKL